jgi:outer membrane protein assembly factor BamB
MTIFNTRPALVSAYLSLIALSAGIQAADWRQFRGPNASGIAANARPPIEWSATNNRRWQVRLPGPGTSSPIVVGSQVFVTCYTGYGDGSNGEMADLQRHLLAIDRNSGRILWQKSVASNGSEDAYSGYLREHGYASHTPTSDGENVYAFFGKSGVHAYTTDGGKLWERQVGQRSNNRRWGSAASLMLHRGKLIVNAADESRAILALDRKTGKELWRAPGDSLELGFGTPSSSGNPAAKAW